MKKAVANLPTAPPGAPVETSLTPPRPTPPPPPPPPTPLMPIRSTNATENAPKISKPSVSNTTGLPSLLTTIVTPPPPPSMSDMVVARCHSCANKCHVTVSEE